MRAKLRRSDLDGGIESSPEEGSPEAELQRLESEKNKQRGIRLRELRLQRSEAQLETETLKARKESADLKGDITPTKTAAFQMSPQMLQVLAGLPDDQRNKVVAAAMMMSGKSDPMTMAFLFPMMGNLMQAKPESTTGDLVKFGESMTGSIRLGFEMARQTIPQGGQQDIVGLFKAVSEIMVNSLDRNMRDLAEKLQPAPSIWERVFADPELRGSLKEFFGGGAQAGQPGLALDIEKLRAENNFRLAQLTMEDRRWVAQHQADLISGQQRVQTLERLLAGPFGALITSLGDGARVRLGGVPSTPSTQPGGQAGVPPPNKPLPTVELITCPVEGCNQQFYVNSGQARFECPSCHTMLGDAETLQSMAGTEEPSAPEVVRVAPKVEAEKPAEKTKTDTAVSPKTTPTEAEEAENVKGTAPE